MTTTTKILGIVGISFLGMLCVPSFVQADGPPGSYLNYRHNPAVAQYVQEIAGYGLASGCIDFDDDSLNSYQVLAQVLANGNRTNLPADLQRAIGDFINYVPNPYSTTNTVPVGAMPPAVSKRQIERMDDMWDHITDLMDDKYGVDFEDCMEFMHMALTPSIPAILQQCNIQGNSLPWGTQFRPELGKALSQAFVNLRQR